ncbi:BTAD domain-containing putative transcriptional regulator [Sphaerisporangium sp. NPDC088356]|uniref:BTAD domain-containing putative transcriptional regulator n=1 Tax=Sphaerisporangium sp. NPDC088356 TaxID=3154871 RepID=UPI00341BE7A6
MEFRLLGPVCVLVDGESALDLGPHQQQAVLAMCMLAAPRPMSPSRIIDALWEDEPPAGALNTVQAYVSKLRRILEPGRVRAVAPTVLVSKLGGYALVIPAESLDLTRARAHADQGARLLGEGDLPGARDELRRALAEWRGDPLSGFEKDSWAREEISHLGELRLTLVEDTAEAEIGLGLGAAVIPELTRLLAALPLRERLRRLRAQALYQAGRQADALATLAEGRRLLVEELGLDPDPSSRELERAILAQDPSLLPRGTITAAPAVPAEPVPEPPPLVGRARESALLSEAVGAADHRVVLIAGEPGIGKTSLAEEAARAARAAGRTVVFGRCWDGSGAPPFWPWAQAVRELTGRDGELAELAGAGEGFPLYEAVVRLVNGHGRVLVVLDDLQWADVSSLGLLEFLAATRACPRLTVVATYRDTGVEQPLSRHLPALVRLPHVERITLPGLSEKAIGEYLGRAGADPALAGRMARLTAGNPFFLGEVVRLGDDAPAPEAVSDVVMGRIATLPPHTGDVLTAAALLGREARLDVLLDVLADTGDVSQDQVLDVLDAAVRARLLAERAEPPIGYRFVHDIVRDVLRSGLAPLRRRRLHARVAAVLERRGDAPPAEIAHHYREGLVLAGTAAKAIEYARQAAAHAMGQLAYEDAVEHLGHAVRLTGRPPGGDPALRCDLLLDLAEAQAAAGMSTAVRATLDEAAALAEEMGDIDRLARAALGFSDLIYWLMFEEWTGMDRFAGRIERVLRDHPGDSPWVPQLLAALAVAGYYRRSLDESGDLAMEAVRRARRSGDDRSLLRTLVAHEMLMRGDADPRERQAVIDEIIEVGVRIGDLPYEWLGREADYITRVSAGDFDRADELLTWLYETALSLRQPAMLSLAAWQTAVTAYLRGRFDQALAGAEESGSAHPEGALGRGDPDSRTQLFRSLVLRCRGRAADALALADGMPAGRPDDLSRRLVRCLALIDLDAAGDDPGRREEVRAIFAELSADGFEAIEHDLYYRFIGDALSEICLAVGDPAAARALYDRITLKDGLFGWSLAGLCLGRLAVVIGDPALAERHLREGLAFVRSSGARLYEAPVLALLAEVTGDEEIREEAVRAASGRVSDAG